MYHKLQSLSQSSWESDDGEMDCPSPNFQQKLKFFFESCNSYIDCINQVNEGRDSKWQDLPMELLVQVLALVDDRTVVVACGVCTGWRDAVRAGILELSFTWCGRNVSRLVQSVAPKFAHLQNCNLRRCTLLNNQAVEAVACNCPDLHILDLSGGTRLTDLSLYALANGCRRLEKLDLSGCVGITEAGLVLLAENCHYIRHLNLCGCDNAGSDKALMALAQNCGGLEFLNVGWCERITDIGVTALANWCPDLRVVDLCGCLLITGQSVIVLADNCLNLRALGLHCCRNITDVAMYALANSSKCRASNGEIRSKRAARSGTTSFFSGKALTSSSIGSCSSIGSPSTSSCSSNSDCNNTSKKFYVQSLSQVEEGYGLVSLNLSGCTALSAVAVQAVCDAFPSLHTCPEKYSLNISGCLNLTRVHCQCVVDARRERIGSYGQQQDYARNRLY
ncbi:hypothetical protein O6H91_18G052100 [Diphasiastrum complanatum]|uniref:Uncharacterized protein n=2 Tax=Diphasiastrum complanatum TaxID=34168 RepID=A0ACC2B2E5_DIPCM|nr:hypothetical protein O6H91_18G052100 [Diphasiastrum complanatum]KAJ7523509.1 hypothetical protein O6H91_18G052100 [Diphasiastrum complanatum]